MECRHPDKGWRHSVCEVSYCVITCGDAPARICLAPNSKSVGRSIFGREDDGVVVRDVGRAVVLVAEYLECEGCGAAQEDVVDDGIV